VSADLRRVARSARRVVDGARGLGLSTTARWGVAQLAHGDAASVNTSLTWVRVRPDATTVVWIANYWSDAYGLTSPRFEACVLDATGDVVAQWCFELAADATETIDVRDVLRAEGRPDDLDGQLLLRVADEHLVPGRPVQVFAEYRRDDGECSGVHGQYGLVDRPVAQRVAGMRVEAGPGVQTGFVVTNAYDGPGAPHTMHAELTVYAEDGRSRRAELGPIPARGTLVADASALIPDLAAHLGGRPGHARIRLACPSSRIATFVASDAGGLVVNHGTVDRTFDQERGIAAEWSASDPVASVVVVVGAARETVVTLPNVWGPRADRYVARVRVFTLDGDRIADRIVPVERDALRTVSLRDVLGPGVTGVFAAEVTLVGDRGRERPHTFDVLVGFVDDGVLRAEAQVGSEFSNGPVPPGVRWPDVRRTRIFGRVDERDGRETSVFLAYPVAGTDPVTPTHPRLTLVSADGTRTSARVVELAPHGALCATVGELFPDAAAVLGAAGTGQVRVRDTEARLYGYSWVTHPTARTFPFDHLIGG
jgi:hypothetical protein